MCKGALTLNCLRFNLPRELDKMMNEMFSEKESATRLWLFNQKKALPAALAANRPASPAKLDVESLDHEVTF